MVELDGPVHADPVAGTARWFCRRQRDVRSHRENGTGAATRRRLGHRSKNGAGIRRMDRNAPTAGGSNAAPNWREAFAKWSEISNEELIRNQRSDGFLQAQKELLQSGLKLRSRQDDVVEAASAMFGMPGRKDFDEVTRQLTELRREVRALGHRVSAQERGSRSVRARAADPVARSDSQPNTQ